MMLNFINKNIEICEIYLQKRSTIAFVLSLILLLIVGFYRLETVPSLWWDEGWTLSVARNWVVMDHYGRLNAGEPVSAQLSASFPVVASVAASFKIFGVGVWQGRLPGVLITLVTVLLFYRLTSQLYSRRIAAGAVGVLLLMSISPDANFMLVGRQVLAEMHSLFYLLAGFALFWGALRTSAWLLLPATLFWGLALISKSQIPPFWLASLLVPLGLALLKRWYRIAVLIILSLVGSWYAANFLRGLVRLYLSGMTVAGEPISGMYQAFAIVPDLWVRLSAIITALVVGFPALVGLVYAFASLFGILRRDEIDRDQVVMRLSLLTLAGSWFAWYMFFGIYFVRYLFPAVFIGSIFASVFLHHFTGGFNIPYLVRNASAVLTKFRLDRGSIGALIAVLMLASVPLTLISTYLTFQAPMKSSLHEVTAYLDERIDRNAIIETYESELLFLSDHRFHFPPDQVHVELVRRKTIDPHHPVGYDPLTADPDYLIVGGFDREWGLYDQVLASGAFRLVQSFSQYSLYQRVR
jgi:hypothetical protein